MRAALAALRRVSRLPLETIGINRRNVELVYALNPRRYFDVADDKLLTKRTLSSASVAVPRTLAVCRALAQIPGTLERIRDCDQLVIKPAASSQGTGILVVVGRHGDQVVDAAGRALCEGDLARHMAEIVYGTFSKDRPDVAMVEERIVAHPLLDGVARAGLPDIRVIVLDGRARMAMLRLATARSGGRANLHRGGVGVAVDLETGETLRAVQGGRPIERHPDTGVPLVGLQIPSWADVVRTAELSSHAVPHGFLGVDVVVDHTGRALVLEINVRPGLEIQNVHGVGLGAMLGGAET